MTWDLAEKVITISVIVAMFVFAFWQERSEKKELEKKGDA